MNTELVEAYIAAFMARCDAMSRPGCTTVNEQGLHGLVSHSDEPPSRLLITNDRAHDPLAALLPDAGGGVVSVFAAAARCADLVAAGEGWKPKLVTAMIHRDLRTVPEVPLPAGLTLRPIRRRDEDPDDGVALDEAVAVATRAEGRAEDEANSLASYLRSMPPSVRLFAAVDDDGVIRATSGSGTFDEQASVIFVNTEQSWRRRGVGLAITAAALNAARAAGATQAHLDASGEAIGIYERLGFEKVAETTQFYRAGAG